MACEQELRRALTLMEDGAPLVTICASIKNEEGYQSLAGVRKSERKKRIKTNAKERERLATMSKSGPPPPPMVKKEEVVKEAQVMDVKVEGAGERKEDGGGGGEEQQEVLEAR